jgi:hypothetical protein
MTSRPLKKLGFLYIVPFEREDPAAGPEEALRLFAYAEELGPGGGWVRSRHILEQLATVIGPALGWTPCHSRG